MQYLVNYKINRTQIIHYFHVYSYNVKSLVAKTGEFLIFTRQRRKTIDKEIWLKFLCEPDFGWLHEKEKQCSKLLIYE